LLGLGLRPVVYLLPSFPEAFKARVREQTEVVEVSPGLAVVGGAFSTGEMGGAVLEQALVLRSEQGLVVLTGCAHPGIAHMIERAQQLFGGQVHLVLGGFHLGDRSVTELGDLLARFRSLGVETVAPCHCAGDRAIEMFRGEFGEDFLQVGVGRVVLVGP
jgi:7,8-dihydropterin-6-yl-methyl-4-(beta-D-ribofuranosyl)aminobenzene 5'-phosphate synthase